MDCYMLSQGSLVCFQILLNGFNAVARVAGVEGIGLSQFVMHEQLAHHDYMQVCFSHAPELTSCQMWSDNAIHRIKFYHVISCLFP